MCVLFHERLDNAGSAVGRVVVNYQNINRRFKLAHARNNRRDILRLIVRWNNDYNLSHLYPETIARHGLLRNAKP
jgi:hypothetical protein